MTRFSSELVNFCEDLKINNKVNFFLSKSIGGVFIQGHPTKDPRKSPKIKW